MARERRRANESTDHDKPRSQSRKSLFNMSQAELLDFVTQLAAAGPSMDPFEHAARPERRRPRRADVVTYRIRIDIAGAKPPLWRRLELASDLFLDDVDEIIQLAFGWTASHLHRFGSGPDFYSHQTQYYLCPFEVEEGEEGVPEADVRIDEVLTEVGDKLLYNYDFGDDWQHKLKLEAVLPRDESTPRAVCTAGRRAGPPEDCGGIGGYELIVAATDPTRDDHAEAAAEFDRVFGSHSDRPVLTPTPFDIDLINDELAAMLDDTE